MSDRRSVARSSRCFGSLEGTTVTLRQRLTELAEETGVDEATQTLVWSAYTDDETLDRVIAGDEADPGAAEVTSSENPAPVWLSSVKVQGFRGIGPATELLLNPGPGLTLVVGRNGSGKSSFAEGLEALLTGDNERWRNRPAAWQHGWRNLHVDGSTEVSAEFQREGDVGSTDIRRVFGQSFADTELTTTTGGVAASFDDLGWDGSLATFKPFLSYNELGTMLEQKPSAIYDSLAGVLGLDRLTDAAARLRNARLAAEKPGKLLKNRISDLKDSLAGCADERAAVALTRLDSRTLDLDALATLATQHPPARPELKQLATIVLPDAARCLAAADSLRQALAAQAALDGTDAERASRIADLLDTALEAHRHDGDGDCPVCGQGRLDASWAIRAGAEAAALREQSAEVAESIRNIRRARQEALACLSSPPNVLAADVDGVDTGALRSAWAGWSEAPAEGFSEHDLIDRLEHAGDLHPLGQVVRSAAASQLERFDEEWRPLAAQLAIFVEEAHTAAASTALAKRLKNAEEFLRSAEATLREERFAPIAARSAELWDGLRQQSNVSLEGVTLAGKTTNRRVDLDVTVDGTETSALGVMSQGELHALALALFLPRVTSDESPFRFVVIDDPVQAMDPARVDGLARVLSEVAQTRQVIVFTHDDRLPAACRRLRLGAEVIEVDRRTGSRVSTRPVDSPAQTALGDAFALAKTESLPPDLQRRVVPMHCRRAVEAAARDQIWRRMLADGVTHAEIDRAIADADKTTELMALLFFGRPAPTPEVYEEWRAIDEALKGKFGFLNKAVHDPPPDLKPGLLVNDARRLVTAIEDYRA